MILKGIMLEYLQRRYPQDKVAVEQSIELIREMGEEDDYPDGSQKARPDLHVPGKLCVEIETLRDVCLKGSNPFVSLEVKLRKKISILSQESVDYVDFKDVNLLRRFMSDRAKIRARRVTGVSVQEQRLIANAVKNAREMALLPYGPAAPRG